MSKKMRSSIDSDIESSPNARERIIHRVQSYMCANQDKALIDISVMAEYLQKKYGEYKMKKRRAFRAFVRSAYAEITNSINEKSDTSFDQDEDDEVYSDREINPLSNELVKLYKKNSDERNGNMRDKELVINISSDDESDTNQLGLESTREIEEYENTLANQQSVEPPKPAPPIITNAETRMLLLKEPTPNPEENNNMKKRALEKPDHNPVLKKKKVMDVRVTAPSVKFKNIGGNVKILKTICRLLTHMKHPEIFDQLGIMPPQGFLLLGPPGCGKSLLAEAIAGELGIGMIRVPSPELVAGVSGESESRIREVFEQAIALAPCVLFLDEVDTIAAHRANAQREMERRMVAQLLTCFDELVRNPNARGVLVLGATNRPEVLDPALRRAGRFDREISLGIPDKEARESILTIHASKLKLDANISLSEIAALTPGFVGADLVELLSEAAITAVNRILDRLKNLDEDGKRKIEATGEVSQSLNSESCSKNPGEVTEVEKLDSSTTDNLTVKNQESIVNEAESTNETITAEPVPCQKEKDCENLDNLLSLLHNSIPLSREQLAELRIEKTDFVAALKVVQPSSKREGFATVPDVTWDDIGSLRNIRQELQLAILAPVRHSKLFEDFGLSAPTGVMLCGPPGCGKTLLAKAIANEAGINFISVKGPELLNMYVGESEKAVRQCFMRARNSAPCVIFFDELDALCPKRSDGDNSATSRVVNQMLTEMDGIEGRKGVYLMAASNRPDIVDPAVLRPGRLDKILYVGLPTADDRVDILKALTKNGTKPRFATNVNLEEIAKSVECEGYSGADLCALVREAATEALRESIIDPSKDGNPVTEVSIQHINVALEKVKPSVQEKDAKHYEKLQKLYASARKSSDIVVPMDSPVDAPMTDAVMEAMETL